mmetsp:Transcript_30511/g.34137  ORF Transcript_30511/g.34137 Transcript_30511/m.34137 type:complete len:229 (+) Transcript_30511:348-1034(+)
MVVLAIKVEIPTKQVHQKCLIRVIWGILILAWGVVRVLVIIIVMPVAVVAVVNHKGILRGLPINFNNEKWACVKNQNRRNDRNLDHANLHCVIAYSNKIIVMKMKYPMDNNNNNNDHRSSSNHLQINNNNHRGWVVAFNNSNSNHHLVNRLNSSSSSSSNHHHSLQLVLEVVDKPFHNRCNHHLNSNSNHLPNNNRMWMSNIITTMMNHQQVRPTHKVVSTAVNQDKV